MTPPAPGELRVFLRHGECVGNVDRLLVAPTDSPLTPRGWDQARAAAASLSAVSFSWILTSPMLRARQTAQAVAEVQPGATVEVVAALRERGFGELDAWPVDRVKASRWSSCRAAWNQASPGGETLAAVAYRAIAALDVRKGRGPTLVVAHAGVIRAVVGLLDGQPKVRIGRMRVPQAQPWHRTVEGDRWGQLLRTVRPV